MRNSPPLQFSMDCPCCVAGLGRQSQGMSTALAVEKTSKRGGKIINVAAERGKKWSVCSLLYIVYMYCMYYQCVCVSEQQLAEEKKKAHSLTDVMRKPTKVVLLKVTLACVHIILIGYTCTCTCIYWNAAVINIMCNPQD